MDLKDPADKVNLVKSLTGKRLEAALAQMVVLIDKREQKPWSLPKDVLFEKATLKEGDYCIKNVVNVDFDFEKNGMVFERKTVKDFCSTIIKDMDRWERELCRLKGHELAYVFIEGTFRDIYECIKRDHPGMNWQGFRGMQGPLSRLLLNRNIVTLPMENATFASRIAYNMMKLYFKDKIQEKGGQ